MNSKLKWKVNSRVYGRCTLEAHTKATYEGNYMRFYIEPAWHNGEDCWELKSGCGVSGLIASSFNKDDLKKIAQELHDGERAVTFI